MQQITSLNEFTLARSSNDLLVCYFSAEWADSCMHMTPILNHLKITNTNIKFIQVDVDESEIGDLFDIECVPTVLFIKQGNVIETVKGFNAKEVNLKVNALNESNNNGNEKGLSDPNQEEKEEVDEPVSTKINNLLTNNQFIIFIKGTRKSPKCKFTRELIDLLNSNKITEYTTYDILSDEELRQELKNVSDWPTYPQSTQNLTKVYLHGEFIGGLDIIKERLSEDNQEFCKQLVNLKFVKLYLFILYNFSQLRINQSKVMLFMKGNATNPQCGFSNQVNYLISFKIVKLLNQQNIKFQTFDILKDQDVRSGLKEFSNWPTFPQLYVDGG